MSDLSRRRALISGAVSVLVAGACARPAKKRMASRSATFDRHLAMA